MPVTKQYAALKGNLPSFDFNHDIYMNSITVEEPPQLW